MSPRKSLSLLLAAAPPLALGAEPLYTDPVGFVKLGNPLANSTTPAVPANKDIYLTVPLETKVEFSGAVLSWSKAQKTVTISGSPNWSNDAWVPSSGSPYSLIVKGGDENGLRGLITNNNSDTLTIAQTSPGDLDGLNQGDAVEIRKAWTIGSLFQDSGVYNGCTVFFFDETKSGTNHSASSFYVYIGGNWYRNSSVAANDDVIHAGEAFILQTKSQPIQNLTLFGDVPMSKRRVDITKDGSGKEDMEIGAFYPVPQKIGDLGIPAGNGDVLYWYDNSTPGTNKSASKYFVSIGGRWYENASFDATDTFELNPGEGFIFQRHQSASMSPLEWSK